MISDAQTLVSNAQAVTATAVSTNTIDLGVARDLGASDLKFVVTVDESFATATSVAIEVISSAAADLGSPTVLSSTGALLIAQLVAGRRPIIIDVPRHVLTAQPVGQRYLGLRYTVAGSNATAGKVTASLVLDAQDIAKNYASGYSIV